MIWRVLFLIGCSTRATGAVNDSNILVITSMSLCDMSLTLMFSLSFLEHHIREILLAKTFVSQRAILLNVGENTMSSNNLPFVFNLLMITKNYKTARNVQPLYIIKCIPHRERVVLFEQSDMASWSHYQGDRYDHVDTAVIIHIIQEVGIC